MPTRQTPDYHAMSARARTIALFSACEAARKKGGHDAARTVWNGWAEPLAGEREKLVSTGQWAEITGYDKTSGMHTGMGGNQPTSDFLARSAIDAGDLVFIKAARARKKDEALSQLAGGRGAADIKVIVMETLDLSGFIFPGNTSFGHCRFKGPVSFAGVQVCGDAAFDDAVFTRKAGFSGMHVRGYVSFPESCFNRRAVFDGAHFAGGAVFSSAHFKGDVSMCGMAAGRNILLADAQFFAGADFSAMVCEGALDMTAARFISRVPQFSDAQFAGPAAMAGLQFPVPYWGMAVVQGLDGVQQTEWLDSNDLAAYAALHKMAASAGDAKVKRAAKKGQTRTRKALAG